MLENTDRYKMVAVYIYMISIFMRVVIGIRMIIIVIVVLSGVATLSIFGGHVVRISMDIIMIVP